jgi:geranylgeranyl reductase family protein
MAIDYYDVAIIGAGPSGCACALALEGKGLKVAIFDKAKFPRDKVCGDAIPGPSFKAIETINKDWVNQMKSFVDKSEVEKSTAFISNKLLSYEWLTFSYNSKRIDFDNFLFQLVKKETQTNIFENKSLFKISKNSKFAHCEFQDGSAINAGIIVGCDGANSIVKKQLLNKVSSQPKPFAAIRAYYTGIEGIEAGNNEFHFIKELDGYFWIFPLKNGWANVGFGIKTSDKKRNTLPTNSRKILEKIISSGSLKKRFKNATLMSKVNGFGLPIWTKKEPISGDGFVLCGDAASLIDPLQGHGIDKAIWSGILASKQIIKCFEKNNFSNDFLKEYDKMFYHQFGRVLLRSYLLMKFILSFPRLFSLIFNLIPNQKVVNWLIKKLKI